MVILEVSIATQRESDNESLEQLEYGFILTAKEIVRHLDFECTYDWIADLEKSWLGYSQKFINQNEKKMSISVLQAYLECLRTLAVVHSSPTYSDKCHNIAFEGLNILNFGMEKITELVESE